MTTEIRQMSFPAVGRPPQIRPANQCGWCESPGKLSRYRNLMICEDCLHDAYEGELDQADFERTMEAVEERSW